MRGATRVKDMSACELALRVLKTDLQMTGLHHRWLEKTLHGFVSAIPLANQQIILCEAEMTVATPSSLYVRSLKRLKNCWPAINSERALTPLVGHQHLRS